MDPFDSILRKARSLPLAERIRLAHTLFEEAKAEGHADESDVGTRGLAAWTESTRHEDWSEFYPPTLRQRKVG